MPSKTTTRPFTDAERAELERLLASRPSRLRKATMGLVNGLLLWAVSLLAVIIVWLIAAAIVKAAAGVSIGWSSPHRLTVVGWSALACAAFAAFHNHRWTKSLKNPAAAMEADLSAGVVSEEQHDFSEAKRFQEPEHGGLIYFLRSHDDQAYVVYDHDSQDLGAGGNEPRRSAFAPRAQLTAVRAPLSRLVLSSRFSGPLLALPEPIGLVLDPSEWPEEDEYCAIPWSRLEAHFAMPAAHNA